ncbi:MAG: glycoside hydrolase family 2 TIM barrel-domain containing protein [Aggregatilineales bacterium]
MRTQHAFNHDWLYSPAQVDLTVPDEAFQRVVLPHTNVVLPYHNFDDAEYQFISTYRKRFTLPEPLRGRRLILHFEGAQMATTLTFNGHTFPEYRGGFTPFEFDVTDYVHEHGENLLQLHLDSRERKDIPPFGFTVDYLVFGGIYREVALRYVPAVHVRNAQVRPRGLLTDAPAASVFVEVVNTTDAPATCELGGHVAGQALAAQTIAVEPHSSAFVTLACDLRGRDLTLWSLETPQLYDAAVTLSSGDLQDTFSARVGLREAVFKDDGFYLNGQRVQLRGLNRHQTFPFFGAAAPARLQRKDADILKYELGLNIVRTSHYPQSRHFLDRCDEIGLLVFEEIPGWQFIGDEDWKCIAIENVREMIQRDWNHPSIVIWGVRINESWDDHAFYTETNRIARELDPTRQTGGVRFFLGSEFLEDVYTLNDFSNGILEPEHTPHLVTEYNGHMFPTKSWDNEERRVEHALRHAKVQSLAHSNPRVSGAVGWCAFDYNTHYEFGAGDRICYHGVMDIFRLPKFAAAVYASQQDPAQRVVLQVASNWQLGDVKEGLIEPIYVFSNCDTVEAYVGDQLKGTFKPDAANWNLPHPPFVLKDLDALLAKPYGDLRVVGYLNGQPVAEQRIAADALPRKLHLLPDDTTLHADGIDMTRVVIKITDQYDSVLPYAISVVQLSIEGDADLFGPTLFPLVGGQAAVYVRARQTAGTVTLRARVDRLPEAVATITLVKG